MSEPFSTPILLLGFNRPDTTAVVFNQIKLVQPKQLFFAVDGPRNTVSGESKRVKEVQMIVDKVDWPCELYVLFREENLGCGSAVSGAITWFFKNVEYGIILEDDCKPDISFFKYCDVLLRKYNKETAIKLISGTNLQNGKVRGDGSYYFTYYANIWGWATWGRVWEDYQYYLKDVNKAFKEKRFSHVFQSKSEEQYWYNQFIKTEQGKANTWDYQLLYAIWKKKGICISPNVNLVENIGFYNNSTRIFLHDSAKMPKSESIDFPLKHCAIEVDKSADRYTFLHIYSHAFPRLLKLVKENSIWAIVRYLINNLKSNYKV